MIDAVEKDKELQEICDFIDDEKYVTRAELEFKFEIIQDSLSEIKQEIQQLRQDITDFINEIKEFKQKRVDVEVNAKKDNDGGNNKIKVEYFSELRKNFINHKR
jgi:vacuolar-type H+-ATPase subunit I/STV1